jgi:hypothetical protein
VTNGIELNAGGSIATERGGARHFPEAKSFSETLERALARVDRFESTSATAVSDLDARTALELQASVYMQEERFELISRLVDHGVSAVKTILQTRI